MAGIYIHIPYCKQKCSYCNFHFSTDTRSKQELVDAICKEAEIRKNELTETVETIYLGGGTPSLLSSGELEKIFETLYRVFKISARPEVTLEANPDDLSKSQIQILKATPVNRLSIGIQSFFDEDLKFMNRAHNSNQALSSVKEAQDSGFENITIDLIYGGQTTSDEMWEKNLETSLGLKVPHISSYALTIEPKTILAHQIKAKKIQDIDDSKQQRQFMKLVETLAQNDFLHYEISNFGKAGFLSQHNSSYWKGIPYLGLGPSAHSYDGQNRSWNIANNTIYINQIKNGVLPLEFEKLSLNDKFNEMLMIRLRMMEGLSLNEVSENFPTEFLNRLLVEIQPHIDNEMLILKDGHLHIAKNALFLSDGIASSLFRI